MIKIEDIYDLIEKEQGIHKSDIKPNSDLCEDLGIDGDDFFDFEVLFSKKFSVDMTGYLWYFHHGEEGMNIGSLFAQAPYQRVQHIPVTPEILLQAAQTKHWPISYPEHELPDKRYDILINQIIVFTITLLIIMGALFKIIA